MNLPRRSTSARCSATFLGLAIYGLYFAAAGAAPAPASPSPAATSSPAASATAAPSPTFTAPPTYDGVQQSRYITTANNAFTAQRNEKFQAFVDARTAFENAGGIGTKGLTDKASVTSRRALLAKLRTANDDYLAFITTQETTYRAELAKTPLTAADIDSLVAGFATKANIPRAIKMQQDEKDLLACSDEMLGALEKWNGQWSLTSSEKLVFKRKGDRASYSALEQKYNGIIKDIQNLQAQASPSPTPAGAATSPAPSPTAAATSTPNASPTP